MGLTRKYAKDDNDFHNLNRKKLCEIMARWSVVNSCCRCHDHAEDDDCTSKCNKACVNTAAYRDMLNLSLALAVYIAHTEICQAEKPKTRKKRS